MTLVYAPSVNEAFAVVDHLNREVWGGAILHILHLVGASVFFCLVVLPCWTWSGVWRASIGWALAEWGSFVGSRYANGIFGIHFALGANVFLGGHSDY